MESESPFGYLYDQRTDEEVAQDYKIYRRPYLTDEQNDNIEKELRKLLIRDRIRFRKRVEEDRKIWKHL